MGGHPAIDFVNTLDDDLQIPETMHGYSDLAVWGHVAGILDADATSSLQRLARKLPDDATKALNNALKLREALRAIFSARVANSPVPEADIETLNSFLRKGHRVELQVCWAGVTRRPSDNESELGYPAQLIARLAADFLLSPSFHQIAVCAASGCGWFFVDKSPSRRRRWCSMARCGNRAKAQRHYRRTALNNDEPLVFETRRLARR